MKFHFHIKRILTLEAFFKIDLIVAIVKPDVSSFKMSNKISQGQDHGMKVLMDVDVVGSSD